MDSINIKLIEDPYVNEFPNRDNVGLVEILKNNRVMLSLNKNALIGLGQELIRMAHNNFQDGYHIHVDPCEKGYLSQTMGFHSQPDSVGLIICCADYDPIIAYIK
jgi:hypothetical protein